MLNHSLARGPQSSTPTGASLVNGTPALDVVTDPGYNDYMEVGVRELKAKLSEYLERVERGEVIRVTHLGRPVAQIVPIPGRGNIELGLAEGWITRLEDRPPEPVVRQRPLPGTRSTTDLIREDRDG